MPAQEEPATYFAWLISILEQSVLPKLIDKSTLTNQKPFPCTNRNVLKDGRYVSRCT